MANRQLRVCAWQHSAACAAAEQRQQSTGARAQADSRHSSADVSLYQDLLDGGSSAYTLVDSRCRVVSMLRGFKVSGQASAR